MHTTQRRNARGQFTPHTFKLKLPVPLWVKIATGIVASNILYNALYYATCPAFDPATNAMSTDVSALYHVLSFLRITAAMCGGMS